MNPEIQTAWADEVEKNPLALGVLRDKDCFCVLGSLVNLFQEKTGKTLWVKLNSEEYNYAVRLDDGTQSKIQAPNSVLRWAGLDELREIQVPSEVIASVSTKELEENDFFGDPRLEERVRMTQSVCTQTRKTGRISLININDWVIKKETLVKIIRKCEIR